MSEFFVNFAKKSNMTYDELAEIIEHEIGNLTYPSTAPELYRPIEDTLQSAGKRLRPVLTLKFCEALCANPLKALNQALAIEMFHNFTLIHDDVMDGSDLRRGRPTVFASKGVAQAILSGDALLTLATAKVADCHTDILPDVLRMFNQTALEVYEGQQLDMDFERRDDVTTDEYLEMIRLKTSVLLGAACSFGAIVAGTEKSEIDAAYSYGVNLGMAFQLRDDELDTYGTEAEIGKPVGGDISNRKKTWLFITASDEAPKQMAKALESNNVFEEVRRVYDSLGLRERSAQLIENYCARAKESLADVKLDDSARDWFYGLAEKLCKRTK